MLWLKVKKIKCFSMKYEYFHLALNRVESVKINNPTNIYMIFYLINAVGNNFLNLLTYF